MRLIGQRNPRLAAHLRDNLETGTTCSYKPWADGGYTELDNLISLCRPHHRAVHEPGWRITIADGVAVVEPPP